MWNIPFKSRDIIIGKSCKVHGYFFNGKCSEDCENKPLSKYHPRTVEIETAYKIIEDAEERVRFCNPEVHTPLCEKEKKKFEMIPLCLIYKKDDIMYISLTCLACVDYYVNHRLIDSSGISEIISCDNQVCKYFALLHYINSTFRPKVYYMENENYIKMVHEVQFKFSE